MQTKTRQFNISNPLETGIAERLYEYHKGIRKSISNKRLADIFSLDERTLRRIITKLINECGVPIGSSSHNGIFFISTDEECDITNKELSSRIIEMARRRKNNKKNWKNYKNKEEIEQLSFSGVGELNNG